MSADDETQKHYARVRDWLNRNDPAKGYELVDEAVGGGDHAAAMRANEVARRLLGCGEERCEHELGGT